MKKTIIFTHSEMDARRKMKNWYSDKKNLQIHSCDLIFFQETKGYEISFSYDENNNNEQTK